MGSQLGPRVVLATRNEHKVAELNRILADAGFTGDLVGLEAFPDAPEVADVGRALEVNPGAQALPTPAARKGPRPRLSPDGSP